MARETKRIKTLRRFQEVASATLTAFGANPAVVTPLLGDPPAILPRILYEVGGVVTDTAYAGVSISGMTVIMEVWAGRFEDTIRIADLVVEALDTANIIQGIVGALDEPSQDAATLEDGSPVFKHTTIMTLVVPAPLAET